MKWTAPRKRIGSPIVRQPDMAHFRVRHTVHRAAVDDGAASDPGTDRQVEETRNTLCRAPARFRQRSRVDIGIEADRDSERRANRSRQIGIWPASLRRRSNVTIVWRRGFKVDRPERTDPHCRQTTCASFAAQKLHCGVYRCSGGRRRNPRQFQIVRPRAHPAYKLSAARLNSTENFHTMASLPQARDNLTRTLTCESELPW